MNNSQVDEKEVGENDGKQTVRANDFRYIPCDYANLALREDGIKLILGIEEVNGVVTELVGVQMTLETALGLAEMLRSALEHAKDEFDIRPKD